MRPFGQWAALPLLGLLAACSQHTATPIATAPPTASAPAVVFVELEAGQRLYRVQYSGPRGSGGMRLTVRYRSAERFQIGSADLLGRPLWSLDVRPEAVLILDHRQEVVCDVEGEVRLPEVALEPLPLSALPRVLAGRLPAMPAVEVDPTASKLDFRDSRGRRWTATRSADGEFASWALWEGDRPLLWWSRSAGGGILSHRDGVQFRWRETVAEPLAEEPPPLPVPDEYVTGACHVQDLP